MAKLSLHKAAHDPRAAALVALSQVIFQNKESQAAVDEALSSSTLMPTDKRLCTELIYGTLRSFIQLDWILKRYLSNPDKLPGEMRLLLAQSLYELMHLRIPARASVDWAVNHIRNRFSPGLAKVANGVLRSVQRELRGYKDGAIFAEETSNSFEALGLKYSVPTWIAELWVNSYGQENALQYLENLRQPAPSGLRFNVGRTAWEEAKLSLLRAIQSFWDNSKNTGAHPAPLLEIGQAGLAVFTPLPHEARGLVQSGYASRQSAAAYEVLSRLNPQTWPEPVWDACAGRGNKTLALLEQGIKVELATDPAQKRIQNLGKDIQRLALSAEQLKVSVVTAENEANTFTDTARRFGTVLIDAPCSGLGTLNRRPEIRIRRTPEDVQSLIRTQAAILDATAKCLKPGGRIAYITCTLNPAENEDQIGAFVARHPGASLMDSWQTPADSPLKEFFYGSLVQLP